MEMLEEKQSELRSKTSSSVRMNGKKKIAVLGLTSCGGCQLALFELGEKFLRLLGDVEVADFPLVEDEEDGGGDLDIAFVEGIPANEHEIATLKRFRSRSKLLVALGDCATCSAVRNGTCKDGVQGGGNFYKYVQGIRKKRVRPLMDFVEVDFVLAGCPVDSEAFVEFIRQRENKG